LARSLSLLASDMMIARFRPCVARARTISEFLALEPGRVRYSYIGKSARSHSVGTRSRARSGSDYRCNAEEDVHHARTGDRYSWSITMADSNSSSDAQQEELSGHGDEAFVREALREGASRMGLDVVPDEEQVRAALGALHAVQEGRPEELTEKLASNMEQAFTQPMPPEAAEVMTSGIHNAASQLTPALRAIGVTDARAAFFEKLMHTMGDKLVKSMEEHGQSGEKDGTLSRGEAVEDATDAGSAAASEAQPEHEGTAGGDYVSQMTEEFASRVYMLLYKLALYARPLDELPAYEGEPSEDAAVYEEVLSGTRVDGSAAAGLQAPEFHAVYLERLRRCPQADLEPAERQLLLWTDRVLQGDAESKHRALRQWHNAVKLYSAQMNTHVAEATSDTAVRAAVPGIYPLAAAQLLVFWDEPEFEASRKEVLLDLEQINLLAAVSAGLPAPMQRIMAKFASTAAFDAAVPSTPDGSIDQDAFLGAAMDAVTALDSKDMMELMHSVPEMLRGLSGPMASMMKSNSGGGGGGGAPADGSAGAAGLLSALTSQLGGTGGEGLLGALGAAGNGHQAAPASAEEGSGSGAGAPAVGGVSAHDDAVVADDAAFFA